MTTDADAEDIDAEEELDRRDRVVKAGELRQWLIDNRDREEYSELEAVVNGAEFRGKKYSKFEYMLYSERLLEIGRPDLLEPLLHAEAEWRADRAAASKGRTSLGMPDVVSSHDRALSIPVVQCGWKDRRNIQCEDASLPGAVRCAKHGGDWLDPKIRHSLLLNSYARLVEASEVAVDALVWVAEHGKREDARVMAAREILDRSGIRAGVDVNINMPAELDAGAKVSELHARLDKMAESLTTREAIMGGMLEIVDAEIIEVEVIEDDGDESYG